MGAVLIFSSYWLKFSNTLKMTLFEVDVTTKFGDSINFIFLNNLLDISMIFK